MLDALQVCLCYFYYFCMSCFLELLPCHARLKRVKVKLQKGSLLVRWVKTLAACMFVSVVPNERAGTSPKGHRIHRKVFLCGKLFLSFQTFLKFYFFSPVKYRIIPEIITLSSCGQILLCLGTNFLSTSNILKHCLFFSNHYLNGSKFFFFY